MNEVRSGDSDFLRGGGELGELMRAFDWASTNLGAPADWPQSLKTAIRIMLTSRQPIWIGWGHDLIYFYNDAYKSIIGGKHPWALGRPAAQVWAEIWGDIGPMLQTAMTGEEGTFAEEQLLIMERSGYPEETYYTFSYSPIPDDDGSAGGIICANSEDTGRVIGERQLALLRELGAKTANARTWLETADAVQAALCADPRDIPFALLYMADDVGQGFVRTAICHVATDHIAAPEQLTGREQPWPFAEMIDANEPMVISDLTTLFGGDLRSAAWGVPVERAALLPVGAAGETGRPGVLIVGLNPYRLFDADYQGFLNLAAGQIAAAFANAEAYDHERRRVEELAEIDRAKTAFFSNVSHEFRTPLTLMLGPLEEILNRPESGALPDDRQLIDVAHRNGLRLMRLVNALLDFSRIEAGRVEAHYRPTDLSAFTAELASSFRSAMEKAGLDLVIDAPRLSDQAFVDPDMWEKIVLNLLSNAFKFTMEGAIRVTLGESGGTAFLAVTDTGIGIAEENLPKLFERFQRVDGAKGRSFEGSGIGLALVQELARLHGGDVTVESELGRGSTFRVSIPLGSAHLPADRIADDAETFDPARADAFVEEALRWLPDMPDSAQRLDHMSENRDISRWTAESSARILLADDNSDMRDYVRRLLAGRYEVEAVADGEAALHAIAASIPDLVLTDVMMPRLDGFELLARIRADEKLRDLPVIMLSARAGEEAQVEGIEAGADDYLIKPFSARELIARVSTNLEMARSRRATQRALEALNQQLSEETARLSKLFAEAPSIMALLRGPDHVFELANPAYLRLIGGRSIVGKPLRDALPELAGQGFLELLDQVRETAQPFVGQGMKVVLQQENGKLEDRAIDFVYQPILGSDGSVKRSAAGPSCASSTR